MSSTVICGYIEDPNSRPVTLLQILLHKYQEENAMGTVGYCESISLTNATQSTTFHSPTLNIATIYKTSVSVT